MTKYNGQIIDIKAKALANKCNALMAPHLVSGCDSQSCQFGNGNIYAVDLNMTMFADTKTQEAACLDNNYVLFALWKDCTIHE